MLPRLVLLGAQLAVGWHAAPYVVRDIPGLGGLEPVAFIARYIPGFTAVELIVYAAVFALLVWVVGLILSEALKNIRSPSPATLLSALVVALACAALVALLPRAAPALADPLRALPALAYPLFGAVLGYQVHR
jgi:hypothetical protein